MTKNQNKLRKINKNFALSWIYLYISVTTLYCLVTLYHVGITWVIWWWYAISQKELSLKRVHHCYYCHMGQKRGLTACWKFESIEGGMNELTNHWRLWSHEGEKNRWFLSITLLRLYFSLEPRISILPDDNLLICICPEESYDLT